VLDSTAVLTVVALVALPLIAIGFQLRREAEEFYKDGKEDTKEMRAILQAQFHQQFTSEVCSTIDEAAGGRPLSLTDLKKAIGDEALKPTHATKVEELGDLLERREHVLVTFKQAVSGRSNAGNGLIGVGLVVLSNALLTLIPDAFLDQGLFLAFLLEIPVLAVIVPYTVQNFSQYAVSAKEFRDEAESQFKEL